MQLSREISESEGDRETTGKCAHYLLHSNSHGQESQDKMLKKQQSAFDFQSVKYEAFE